jgi:uncharacterized protein (DUF2141 family)
MRVSRLALVLSVGAAALRVQAAAAEDLTITYKVTGRGDGVTTATQYYSATKIRTSDGEHDAIVDLAGGRIITVDHKNKQYSEILVAEMEAMMKSANAQMEEAMKNVPPNMRDMIAKKMGGASGDSAFAMSVTKGGTRSVAGYTCQDYTIAMGENVKTETCNTTALAIPFDPTQFRKMWSFTNPAFMNAAKNAAKAAEQMQQVQGLPLAEKTSFSMMGRNTTVTKEATEVKKGAIAASVFEPPAGYKKIDSPMKAMQQGRPKR